MKIEMERVEYGAIAMRGFEMKVEELFGRTHFLALACHKGERRSPTAARLLTAYGYPVANSRVVPSLSYGDFLDCRFVATGEGLMVPDKTEVPFGHLLVFCDGSKEEEASVRKIKALLDVEARGALDKCVIAEVRDQESLIGIA